MYKKVYWRRAVKYMVRLLVLVFALIAVMVATGMARTGADGNLADVFMTPKALLLFAIIVFVVAGLSETRIYPSAVENGF